VKNEIEYRHILYSIGTIYNAQKVCKFEFHAETRVNESGITSNREKDHHGEHVLE